MDLGHVGHCKNATTMEKVSSALCGGRSLVIPSNACDEGACDPREREQQHPHAAVTAVGSGERKRDMLGGHDTLRARYSARIIVRIHTAEQRSVRGISSGERPGHTPAVQYSASAP